MRRVALLLALMVAGCSPGGKDAAGGKTGNTVATSKPGTAAPVPEPPVVLSVRSEAKGFRIVLTNRLPVWRGRRLNPDDPYNSVPIHPETPGGKALAAQGWAILSEKEVHGYTVVNFAGDLDEWGPAHSDLYVVKDGHIALFRGRDLKVLVSRSKADRRAIGRIHLLASGDFRITDGNPDIGFAEVPLADLHFGADGSVAIWELPASESVCGGRAVVPNLYRMPINRARKLLRKAGWLPDPPKDVRQDLMPTDPAFYYAAHGIAEALGCRPTHLPECYFSYKGKAGTLMITATETEYVLPPVIDYEVKCR